MRLNGMSANLIDQMITLTLRPLETAVRRISAAFTATQSGPDGSSAASITAENEIFARRDAITKLKLVLAANVTSDFAAISS